MSELAKRETGSGVATVERTRGGVTYVPRFDIVETEEELMLFGDVPGVTQENVELRFENEHLVINAKVEPRHAGRKSLYAEYGIGDFYREFRISEAVDAGKISAELNNGVLTVHLPKTEQVKPRRIEVKTA
jgi:HSP20 family molecular chaperone IbpA